MEPVRPQGGPATGTGCARALLLVLLTGPLLLATVVLLVAAVLSAEVDGAGADGATAGLLLLSALGAALTVVLGRRLLRR